MKKSTQPTTFLTIRAENAKGVLARILGILDRPNYYVAALTMAKTDINGQVVITVEAHIDQQEVPNVLRRIGKIIEVASASARPTEDPDILKATLFEIDADGIDNKFWQLIQKYGATVTFSGMRLLIQKTGHADDLLEFYNRLDQVYLKSYSETILTPPE